jgi:uncharacterized ParB-like nuclease family protein
MIDVLTVATLGLTVLLFAWWGLDRLEDSRQAARERLASDVRARRRMRAVLSMTDRRP